MPLLLRKFATRRLECLCYRLAKGYAEYKKFLKSTDRSGEDKLRISSWQLMAPHDLRHGAAEISPTPE